MKKHYCEPNTNEVEYGQFYQAHEVDAVIAELRAKIDGHVATIGSQQSEIERMKDQYDEMEDMMMLYREQR